MAKGTPAAEVARLHDAISASLRAARRRIEALGVEVAPTTVQASQRMISEEVKRWGRLVQATGAVAD